MNKANQPNPYIEALRNGRALTDAELVTDWTRLQGDRAMMMGLMGDVMLQLHRLRMLTIVAHVTGIVAGIAIGLLLR